METNANLPVLDKPEKKKLQPGSPTQNILTFVGQNPAAVVFLLLGLALLPRVLGFLGHSWDVLGWPYQIDYDEGLNLSAAWHLSQLHNIYANSQPDRFIAAPYPPLFFTLNALGIKLFGIQFTVGRAITLLASFSIAGLIGGAVWLSSRRNGIAPSIAAGAALVSGLFWFGLPPVYIWSTFYKQDMLAIAIALLALVMVYRWQDSRWLCWAAPLMALAFFAKQNELIASAVGCGYIIWRDWRRGWKLALLTALCIGLPFAALNLLTKNGYYNHIIGYQLVPWNFEDMARRLGKVLVDQPVLIALAVVYGLGCLVVLGRSVAQARGQDRWLAAHRTIGGWLFPLYLVAATTSLFTIGAYQGNYNLVLDLFPPLLIVAGGSLAWLMSQLQKAEWGGAGLALKGAALLVGLLVGWQALNLADPGTYYHSGSMPGLNQRSLMQGLQKQIDTSPGPLITEDVYLAFAHGRAVPYDNLYHMRLQSEDGKWDDRQFLQDIRDRRFGLVLLEHGSKRWTERAWQVLNQNYELTFPEGIDLWRPRPRPLVPETALAACTFAAPDNAGTVALQGWSQGPTNQPLRAGGALTLTTYWQASTAFNSNYTLFVHLEDSTGKVVAQRDSSPVGPDGQPLPLPQWKVNTPLTIDQSLPLPANLAPGDYRLVVGAYRPQASGLQPLTPACATTEGGAVLLGNVKLAN